MKVLVVFIESKKTFSDQDHNTWRELFARQINKISGLACKEFNLGLINLSLSPSRILSQKELSNRLRNMTGWEIVDAENEYLNDDEWFSHLKKGRFPCTNFIRKPEELEFTPLPDLFHEVFGHLPFMTLRHYSKIVDLFALCYDIAPENMKKAIYRLWWHTLEFGLIKEDGEIKILGAGLLSSPKEFIRALDPNLQRNFNFELIAKTEKAKFDVHNKYFVLESWNQLEKTLNELIEKNLAN